MPDREPPLRWFDILYIALLVWEGAVEQWEELVGLVEGFPHGEIDPLHGRWITMAIFSGSRESIQWMLSRHVDLGYREADGLTAIHAALERDRPAKDKYQVLALLLEHGAPTNLHGFNDWTPAHKAVGQNDLRALQLLAAHGADLAIRTRIDYYETPLEMARREGHLRVVQYLESLL
jgi:ankyrin repeat protein